MVHWDRKAFRRQLVMQVAVVLLLITVITLAYDHGKGGLERDAIPLELLGKEIVSLKEISGLVHYSENGATEIALVGDDKAQIYLKNARKELSFKNILIDRFSLCQAEDFDECAKALKKLSKNWEALAIDGKGRFFVLQEHSQSIIALDQGLGRIVHVLHFNLDEAFGEAIRKGTKKVRKSAQGEGLVLLKEGHILVAKEAFPVALVEFGPKGDAPLGVTPDTVLGPQEEFLWDEGIFHEKLVPVSTWLLAAHGKCDISDLAFDKDGALLALSEVCGTIQRFAPLIPGRDAEFRELYRLPPEIKHPEGLTALGDEWLVGSDVSSRRHYNFYRLKAQSGLR